MRIAEVFYSIQGEGMLVGVPSVFIRTTGCNLRCTWCDTPYTSWQPEGEDVMLGALLARIRRYWASHVVITGGEPMIAKDVELLASRLRDLEQHITIETAGTVYKEVECDLMSISPKLANSVPTERENGIYAEQHDRLRYQPDVLRQLIGRYQYQLKFVVAEEQDMNEVISIVREIGADRGRVILMPEGTDAAVLKQRNEWLVKACLNEGYRYSPRLHIDLFGNKRGT